MTDAKHGTQRRALLRNGLFGMAAAAAGGAAMAAPGAAVKKDAGAEEYDIVIVGTGCAGLSAAIEAETSTPRVPGCRRATASRTTLSRSIRTW